MLAYGKFTSMMTKQEAPETNVTAPISNDDYVPATGKWISVTSDESISYDYKLGLATFHKSSTDLAQLVFDVEAGVGFVDATGAV